MSSAGLRNKINVVLTHFQKCSSGLQEALTVLAWVQKCCGVLFNFTTWNRKVRPQRTLIGRLHDSGKLSSYHSGGLESASSEWQANFNWQKQHFGFYVFRWSVDPAVELFWAIGDRWKWNFEMSYFFSSNSWITLYSSLFFKKCFFMQCLCHNYGKL